MIGDLKKFLMLIPVHTQPLTINPKNSFKSSQQFIAYVTSDLAQVRGSGF